MAAQVALKRQQAAEDAIALGLRACAEGTLPMLTPGPLWGPGTVTAGTISDADYGATDGANSDMEDDIGEV